MKNVLVIYQNIPDSTKTYMLKGVDAETLEEVKKCHNCYINDESENESCDKLNYWLSDKEYFNEEWAVEVGLPKEECGKFAHFETEELSAIDAKEIDFVVITGFLL